MPAPAATYGGTPEDPGDTINETPATEISPPVTGGEAESPAIPAAPRVSPRKARLSWKRWVPLAAALVVGLGVGAAAAASDPTKSDEYLALQDRLSDTSDLLGNAQDRVRAAESDAETAKTDAAKASSAVAARERDVTAREAAVTTVEQTVAAASVEEGTWTVGRDIDAGTYRTSEAVTGQCYWGIYTSGTNGSDIINNDIVSGGFPTVTLREGQDFENSRCGTFVKQ
jgi:hypothetical protein